jgi:hypothetical protein
VEVLYSTEQEQHLAIEMSSSESLTPKGRERAHLQNNNKARRHRSPSSCGGVVAISSSTNKARRGGVVGHLWQGAEAPGREM